MKETMRNIRTFSWSCLGLLSLLAQPALAQGLTSPAAPAEAVTASQPTPVEVKKEDNIWSKVQFGTQWFLSEEYREESSKASNRFSIGRGYWTLKLRPVPWFEPRLTLDTSQDDKGNWMMRLKYLYGRLVLPVETSYVTEPDVEVGMVHNPWFDFEEGINRYRMQGTMFVERAGILNSADLGVTFSGLFGQKLSKAYQDSVSSKFPGKFGSYAFGLYNGGGYAAPESNKNKVFMGRLTARPLGGILPNLQLSYFYINGAGNTTDEPDWRLHHFMASFEHEYFVLTGQYSMGDGNNKGGQVRDDNGKKSLDLAGYSVFGELKLPWIDSSLIGRFDRFDWEKPDTIDTAASRLIVGFAYRFYKQNTVLVDMDRVFYDLPGKNDDYQVKATLQIVL